MKVPKVTAKLALKTFTIKQTRLFTLSRPTLAELFSRKERQIEVRASFDMVGRADLGTPTNVATVENQTIIVEEFKIKVRSFFE